MHFRVLVEAACIGAILALMMYITIGLLPSRCAVETDNRALDVPLAAFICGGLFHIGCEVSGLNAWYARTYNELH